MTTSRPVRKTAVATKTRPIAKAVTAKAVPPKAIAAPVVAAAPAKVKHKLVRDSFTIPKSEYTVLEGLKLRATNLKRPTKKSELLRAGIMVLNAMTDKAFLAALGGVPSLKTGRPKGVAVTASKTPAAAPTKR